MAVWVVARPGILPIHGSEMIRLPLKLEAVNTTNQSSDDIFGRDNQHYQEGEDSSWEDNFYSDVAGRLRFVLMTSYAINGTREQHRAYFDESGHLIYHGRRLLKGAGYCGPPVEDLKELVHMDPKKDFAEEAQGCKEESPQQNVAPEEAE